MGHPLQWVTLVHNHCSLFSRFLVFNISLHMLFFYLPPPYLPEGNIFLPCADAIFAQEQRLVPTCLKLNFPCIHREYFEKLPLETISTNNADCFKPYMTCLTYPITGKSRKEKLPWAIIEAPTAKIKQVTRTMNSS